MIKTRVLATALGSLLAIGGGVAIAQKQTPKQNVSGARHPNLAAAQRFAVQAYDKIVAAQEANEFDLGGHAKKAKELLEQVNNELKQAAQTANKNK
jgi:hypothetical protein